jgi:tetratricopeptide (TPR) repeat protein
MMKDSNDRRKRFFQSWTICILVTILAALSLPGAGRYSCPWSGKTGSGQDHKVLKVSVLRADVRATADVTGKVIFQVKLGDMLEYKAKVGNWYELLGDDGLVVGYVSASVVDEVVVKIPEITEQEKYMTAAKQISTIATTLADYITDNSFFRGLEKPEDYLLKKESLIHRLLVPKYAKDLPLTDPWGGPYEIFLGNNAWGKARLGYFGIQETTDDDFLIVSKGKLGAYETWKYDLMNPGAGLYSEFDARKNIINYNGAFIRGKGAGQYSPPGNERSVSVQAVENLIKQGLVFLKQSRHDEAIAAFTKAIELDPKNGEAFRERGFTNYMKDDYENAIADYSKAIFLDPMDQDAYHTRSLCQFKLKRYAESLEDCETAMSFNPQDASNFSLRSQIKQATKDYNGAIQDINKAIELSPSGSAIYFAARADIKKDMADDKGAIADYGRSLEIEPDDWIHLYYRAELLLKTGDPKAALIDITKALKIKDYGMIRDLLKQIQAAIK